MKKTHALGLALCAALALALAACGGAATPPSSSTPSSSTDGGVQVANPLVKSDSLEALNQAVGVKVALPEGATDAVFYVLDKDVAQINFTVDEVTYILRGTLRTEDVAGVYGDIKDIGSFSAVAGDKTADVAVTSTEEMSIYRWSWDKANYTLVCAVAAKDAGTETGTGKVANACAVACA